MKILKGYLGFILLVILNTGSMYIATTGILKIKDCVGWQAIGQGASAFLGIATSVIIVAITGWILSISMEEQPND